MSVIASKASLLGKQNKKQQAESCCFLKVLYMQIVRFIVHKNMSGKQNLKLANTKTYTREWKQNKNLNDIVIVVELYILKWSQQEKNTQQYS